MRIAGLVLFTAFLALLVSFGDQGFMRLRRLKVRETALRADIRTLAQDNRRLVREIDLLRDPSSLERHVREELGYVREDEILYEFPSSPR